MKDDMKNKLYCNHKLKIREYLSKSKSKNIRSDVNEVFLVGKRFCVLLPDESKNIDNHNAGSYVTDLFEMQTKFPYEIFIRSTAKLKRNIRTDTYYVDKNILRNKIGTVGNTNVISIAIHHIDFKKRKKIMDCHQSLYAALKEL